MHIKLNKVNHFRGVLESLNELLWFYLMEQRLYATSDIYRRCECPTKTNWNMWKVDKWLLRRQLVINLTTIFYDNNSEVFVERYGYWRLTTDDNEKK